MRYDYVVVITRGHVHDADCLREIFKGTQPAYLGLIGSRRRVRGLFEMLVEEGYPKEMELLYHLAATPNRVYTRNQLLDEVWGFDYFGDSRTVDVHIKRLREKVENVSDQWELKTVWGVGYKFEVKK